MLRSASAILAVLWAGLLSAHASDMPLKATPAVPIALNWAGLYFGLNVGGVWSRTDTGDVTGLVFPAFVIPPPPAPIAVPALAGTIPRTVSRGSAFMGGGQFGYNWQVHRVVYGVETDVDITRGRNSDRATGVPALGVVRPQSVTTNYTSESDWIASVRGRFGYAFDRAMVYATAGAAFTSLRVSATTTVVNDPTIAPAGAFSAVGSQSSTRVGATFGAGFQLAMNETWSVGGEFRHTTFGRQDLTNIVLIPDGVGALGGASPSLKLSTNHITVRLNWRLSP